MEHHQPKTYVHREPKPKTARQLRDGRRQAESRTEKVRIGRLLDPAKRYAVLVVELSETATKDTVRDDVQSLLVINKITDMTPLFPSADLEADETQTGRIEVDKVTRTIEPETPVEA